MTCITPEFQNLPEADDASLTEQQIRDQRIECQECWRRTGKYLPKYRPDYEEFQCDECHTWEVNMDARLYQTPEEIRAKEDAKNARIVESIDKGEACGDCTERYSLNTIALPKRDRTCSSYECTRPEYFNNECYL